MQPHQQRVVDEQEELDVKIHKLNSFVNKELFFSLPHVERDRLVRQLSYMESYSKVLGERIAAF